MSPPRPLRDARLGTVVRGTYRLDELLGRGSSGSVYKAVDLRDGSLVAVKLLRPSVGLAVADTANVHGGEAEPGPEERLSARRFAREARIITGLSHPHIVRIFAFEIAPGAQESYLAMEYLTGTTLGQLLRRRTLTPAEALLLYEPFCDAIAYAHRHGVIHRDLKPDNLFLVDEDLRNPRVLDFGISKVLDPGASQLTDDALLGTPAYMAPELVRAPAQADPRVDIFALGAMLFRALSGRLPFDGETMLEVLRKVLSEPPPSIRRYCPELPEALDQVLLRAMARDPRERFQSAEDFVEALHAALNRTVVTRRPTGSPGAPHDEGAEARRTPTRAEVTATLMMPSPHSTRLLEQVGSARVAPESSTSAAPAPADRRRPAEELSPAPGGSGLLLSPPSPLFSWLRTRWPRHWPWALLVGGLAGTLLGILSQL